MDEAACWCWSQPGVRLERKRVGREAGIGHYRHIGFTGGETLCITNGQIVQWQRPALCASQHRVEVFGSLKIFKI